MKVWSIINITPDSFWQGSRALSERDIAASALSAIADGADMLDVGAYSTRPSHCDVSETEEFDRLDLALATIRRECGEFPLSLDTFRSSIVRRVFDKYGSFTVNDVQGGTIDMDMYSTVSKLKLSYVMMSLEPTIERIDAFFERQLSIARQAGITTPIIIDPGFGFGKSIAQNFDLLTQISRLKRFKCDILAGISRKSMIWRTLNTSAADALAGTCALHWQLLLSGATILRVHDTRPAKDVITLFGSK